MPDSIGGASNDMGYALRLSDGGITLGDWAGQRILHFDSTGKLLRIFGRPGSGPDEFRGPTLVQALPGDSLLIWDPFLRRLSWLSTKSGKSRVLHIEASKLYGSRPVAGVLSNGNVLARREVWPQAAEEQAKGPALKVLLLDNSGDSLLGLPPEIRITGQDPNGFRFFGVGGSVQTDGERIFVGSGHEWRIRVYSSAGDSLGTLERPWNPRAVTEADKASARSVWKRPGPGFLDDARFEKTWPAHGAIVPGADGTVWVLDYTLPHHYTDSVSVFSSDYHFIGTIALPSRFYPTHAGADWILGTALGDDDDFRVRVYQVTWMR